MTGGAMSGSTICGLVGCDRADIKFRMARVLLGASAGCSRTTGA